MTPGKLFTVTASVIKKYSHWPAPNCSSWWRKQWLWTTPATDLLVIASVTKKYNLVLVNGWCYSLCHKYLAVRIGNGPASEPRSVPTLTSTWHSAVLSSRMCLRSVRSRAQSCFNWTFTSASASAAAQSSSSPATMSASPHSTTTDSQLLTITANANVLYNRNISCASNFRDLSRIAKLNARKFLEGPSPKLYLHRISTFPACDMQYSRWNINNNTNTIGILIVLKLTAKFTKWKCKENREIKMQWKK